MNRLELILNNSDVFCEIETKEQQEIDGGFWPVVGAAIVAVGAAAAAGVAIYEAGKAVGGLAYWATH